MNWRWKKRISTLIVIAVLLSIVPIRGVASHQSKSSESSMNHSFIPNDSQPSNDSTNPSSSQNYVFAANSRSDTDTVVQGVYQHQNHMDVLKATYGDLKIKIPPTVYRIKELIDKRTRNSKTFLNSDGSTTVQTATYSINYFDGQTWQDIDTTIRLDNTDPNNTHSMLANNFKVRLNNKGNNQSVKFFVYDQSVTYKAEGMNNVTGIVYDNTITYPNAWQSTDLQYMVENDELKMELHLADNKAPKTFAFELQTKDVTQRLNADGSIDFVDKDGKVNFKIPQMWVQDASSDVKRYDKLKVDVKQKGSNSLIEIALDDKGLQYPIVIDPTTETSNSNSTYRASTGFSSVQGQNNWYYQEWDGTKYSDLNWDAAASVWRSPTNYFSVVWNNGQHPSATDSVRKWVAPVTGIVRISGNVAKQNNGGGDGVNVKILKNSVQVWPNGGWQNIVYNDTIGVNYDITVSVSAGDAIYFILNKNGENSFDSSNSDPWIVYSNFPSNQYLYDITGQLNYLQMPTGEAIQYQYDKNGNLVRKKKLTGN